MSMSFIDEKISEVQSIRTRRGTRYEHKVISRLKELGYNIIDVTSNKLYAAKDPHSGKMCYMDGLYGEYFIEITTSIGDGKASKIKDTSKKFKNQFPNCKILILTEKVKNPRKRDGLDTHIDYVKSQPTIDEVFVGEENLFNFLKTIKGKEGKLTIPFKYTKNKEINNNTKINNMDLNLIRTFIDAGDLTYAQKTLNLMTKEEVVDITIPKFKSNNSSSEKRNEKQKERIRQNKVALESVAKPYDNDLRHRLVDCKEYFDKSSNENVHKMSRETINKMVNSKSLYFKINQRGGKDLFLDIETYKNV